MHCIQALPAPRSTKNEVRASAFAGRTHTTTQHHHAMPSLTAQWPGRPRPGSIMSLTRSWIPRMRKRCCWKSSARGGHRLERGVQEATHRCVVPRSPPMGAEAQGPDRRRHGGAERESRVPALPKTGDAATPCCSALPTPRGHRARQWTCCIRCDRSSGGSGRHTAKQTLGALWMTARPSA